TAEERPQPQGWREFRGGGVGEGGIRRLQPHRGRSGGRQRSPERLPRDDQQGCLWRLAHEAQGRQRQGRGRPDGRQGLREVPGGRSPLTWVEDSSSAPYIRQGPRGPFLTRETLHRT